MNKLIKTFTEQPKRLFILDGLGALLSATLLGLVLPQFEPLFGIPENTLYFLAAIPCVFAVYDFGCYFLLQKNHSLFIRIIAVLNLIYTILSISLALIHRGVITGFGWTYVIIEITILAVLIFIQLGTVKSLK